MEESVKQLTAQKAMELDEMKMQLEQERLLREEQKRQEAQEQESRAEQKRYKEQLVGGAWSSGDTVGGKGEADDVFDFTDIDPFSEGGY